MTRPLARCRFAPRIPRVLSLPSVEMTADCAAVENQIVERPGPEGAPRWNYSSASYAGGVPMWGTYP
jgi:hypothetical protein